jgi:hypothetical protein
MDNETYKICPKCGTACEIGHAFCSKCGNSFASEEYNKGYGRPTHYQDTLDGIPTAEVVDYLDKNSYSYLPKFFKYSNGAKAGWNWPVFVLGLFGLPFVWFFYRKMYKAGLIVLAISVGIVLAMAGVIGVAFNSLAEPIADYVEESYKYQSEHGYSEDFDDLFEYDIYDNEFFNENNAAAQKLYNRLSDSIFFNLIFLANLLSTLQFAFTIILPIFSNYIYYKKAMRDIKALNEGGYPNGYTVQAKGGVKLSAAILSGVGGCFAVFIGCMAIITPIAMNIVNLIIERNNIV